MKRILIFCPAATSLVAILISFHCFSQSDNRPLTKIGGYTSFKEAPSIILNLEQERVFMKHKYFTSGPRIDYYKFNPFFKPTKFSFGTENLILAYEVKVYPFYFKSHKTYQGFFLGIDLCYFTPINKKYFYGPGAGALIGYQYVFKNRFSLGVEGSVIYMQNVNKSSPFRNNPEDRYFFIIPSIKAGLKLGAKKSNSN